MRRHFIFPNKKWSQINGPSRSNALRSKSDLEGCGGLHQSTDGSLEPLMATYCSHHSAVSNRICTMSEWRGARLWSRKGCLSFPREYDVHPDKGLPSKNHMTQGWGRLIRLAKKDMEGTQIVSSEDRRKRTHSTHM